MLTGDLVGWGRLGFGLLFDLLGLGWRLILVFGGLGMLLVWLLRLMVVLYWLFAVSMAGCLFVVGLVIVLVCFYVILFISFVVWLCSCLLGGCCVD